MNSGEMPSTERVKHIAIIAGQNRQHPYRPAVCSVEAAVRTDLRLIHNKSDSFSNFPRLP